MTVVEMRRAREGITRSRWFLPAVCVALGLVYLVAFAIGDDLAAGFGGLALMTALGTVFLLGGRSETIRGLRGDGRDERFAMMDLRATAFGGTVALGAVFVAALVQFARGEDASPYTWIAAIGGVAYLAAILWLRWRS